MGKGSKAGVKHTFRLLTADVNSACTVEPATGTGTSKFAPLLHAVCDILPYVACADRKEREGGE